MARSPWRSATAVALLSVGLMASGGAVAVADPDSGASQGGDGGAESTSHDGAKRSGPIGSVTKAIRTTINGAVGALTPGHQSGPQSSATATDPAGIPLISTVPRMLSDAIRVPTPVTGVSAPPQDAATPTADPTAHPIATASSSSIAADSASDTTPGSTAGAAPAQRPVTTALTTNTDQVTAVSDTLVTPGAAAVPALVAPVTGVQSLLLPAADDLTTTLTAPMPDVLTAIQSMLTSVNQVVGPMTQLPTDFASMMFGAAGVPSVPSTGGHRGAVTPWPSTAIAVGPVTTVRSQPGPTATVGPDHSVTAQQPPPGATSAIAEATSANASARAMPGGTTSEGLQAFFHSYGALVVAASLSALVAAALPGLLALLVPTAAGVGVGYRQAKAGLAVRASGIARFAGTGPIGIVRSGSFVALRSSTPRRKAARAGRAGAGGARTSHRAA